MKNDRIATFLALLLLCAGLATLGVCGWYWQATREHNRLQLASNAVNRHRATMQNLIMEAVEYSKRNPAIDPLLRAYGLKAPAPAANNSPRK